MRHLDRRRRTLVVVALGWRRRDRTPPSRHWDRPPRPSLPRPGAPGSGGARAAPAPVPVPVITPLSRGLSGASSSLLSWAPDGSRLLCRRHDRGQHPPRRFRTVSRRGRLRGERARLVRRRRPDRLLGIRVRQAGDLAQLWIGTPTGGRPFKATAPTAAGRRTTGVTWLDGVTLVVSYTTAGTGPSRLGLVTLTKPGQPRCRSCPATRRPPPPRPSSSTPRPRAGGRPARLPAARPRRRRRLDRQPVGDRAARRQGPQAGRGPHARPPRLVRRRAHRVRHPVHAGSSDLVAYPAAGGSPVVVQAGVTGFSRASCAARCRPAPCVPAE